MIKNFLNWWYWEGLGKKHAEDVYDHLSSDGVYDNTIDYNDRLISLKKIISLLDHDYKKVLDLACGTGVFIEASNPDKVTNVIGVDLSDGMLSVAKQRLAQYKNITFIKQSFMDVDFAENSFDLILMSNASRFITAGKENEFFTKVNKWLTNDGVFLIQGDYLKSDNFMRFIEPIFSRILSKRNYSFKTLYATSLKKQLLEHFNTYRTEELQHRRHYFVKHRMFFCKKLLG